MSKTPGLGGYGAAIAGRKDGVSPGQVMVSEMTRRFNAPVSRPPQGRNVGPVEYAGETPQQRYNRVMFGAGEKQGNGFSGLADQMLSKKTLSAGLSGFSSSERGARMASRRIQALRALAGMENQGRLQEMRNEGNLDVTSMNNEGRVQVAGMNNEAADDRLDKTNAFGLEKLKKKAALDLERDKTLHGLGLETIKKTSQLDREKEKESDYRRLGARLLEKGVPGKQVNSLLNPDMDFPPDVSGIQVPMEEKGPAPNRFGLTTLLKDVNTGAEQAIVLDKQTGEVRPVGPSPFMQGVLSGNIDPNNLTPEQEKQVRQLQQTNPDEYNRLMQMYQDGAGAQQ